MTIKPAELAIQSVPDAATWIRFAQRVNTFGIENFVPGESEKIFALLPQDGGDESPLSVAIDPLAAEATQRLIDFETGAEMPFSPDDGVDAQVFKWWVSFDQPAFIEILATLPGAAEMTVTQFTYEPDNAVGWAFEQEPGLFRLSALDPALSGDADFSFRITNTSETDTLTGTIVNHAVLVED